MTAQNIHIGWAYGVNSLGDYRRPIYMYTNNDMIPGIVFIEVAPGAHYVKNDGTWESDPLF